MPQPDATIILAVAFSSMSGRMAMSAGLDKDLISIYVNSPIAPENFQVFWSPDTEFHAVTSLAWSHNEEDLAFIGISGSRTAEIFEGWLYILNVASGEIRQVLKIGEEIQGKGQRLVNVDEDKAALAWFGNNKICISTRDNSIIAVDCNDGRIETLVPSQDCKIQGPVSVSSSKLRFLKKRTISQGREIEVCDFDGSNVISNKIIPVTADKISPFSWLSVDGKYAMIGVEEEPESIMDKIIIFDVSSQPVIIKEIPSSAKVGSETYTYIPLTILEGKKLVLFEMTIDKDSHKFRRRLCAVNL